MQKNSEICHDSVKENNCVWPNVNENRQTFLSMLSFHIQIPPTSTIYWYWYPPRRWCAGIVMLLKPVFHHPNLLAQRELKTVTLQPYSSRKSKVASSVLSTNVSSTNRRSRKRARELVLLPNSHPWKNDWFSLLLNINFRRLSILPIVLWHCLFINMETISFPELVRHYVVIYYNVDYHMEISPCILHCPCGVCTSYDPMSTTIWSIPYLVTVNRLV